jgi:hypothetical protein
MKSPTSPISPRYIWALFGWEATQATPNRDPYSNALRVFDDTAQVYTSEEHLKHHWRRGLAALSPSLGNGEYADKRSACIYYEKENAAGEPQTSAMRRKEFATAWGMETKGVDLARQISRTALDLALFGFVHTTKDEKFGITNGAKPLFFPATFHEPKIISLGINNAFPGEGKDSAGSSIRQVMLYGHFVTLIEFDLDQIAGNTQGHLVKKTPTEWVEYALDALWAAYTTHRAPSVSQRNQFASFLCHWTPDVSKFTPKDPAGMLGNLAGAPQITNSEAGFAALKNAFPGYLADVGAPTNPTFRHIRHGKTLP